MSDTSSRRTDSIELLVECHVSSQEKGMLAFFVAFEEIHKTIFAHVVHSE